MTESEKEKMLAGKFYIASDPVLVEERARAERLRRRLNVTDFGDRIAYEGILAQLLPNCAPDLWIEPPFYCDYGYNITAGEHVFFNYNCVVLDVCKVTIGSRALIGPNVQIYAALHPLAPRVREACRNRRGVLDRRRRGRLSGGDGRRPLCDRCRRRGDEGRSRRQFRRGEPRPRAAAAERYGRRRPPDRLSQQAPFIM